MPHSEKWWAVLLADGTLLRDDGEHSEYDYPLLWRVEREAQAHAADPDLLGVSRVVRVTVTVEDRKAGKG